MTKATDSDYEVSIVREGHADGHIQADGISTWSTARFMPRIDSNIASKAEPLDALASGAQSR
jgi:hypothetical protein